MNETPDFDRLAEKLADEFGLVTVLDSDGRKQLAYLVNLQLRLMWNARGATDIALVDRELASMMGATKAGPYIKNLDRAVRKLDR